MKNNKLTLHISLVLLGTICHSIGSHAQIKPIKSNTDLQTKIDEIRTLGQTGKEEVLITNSTFDQKLDSTLNKVSGFAYKDGKAGKTSATIDEKSLTVNYNLFDEDSFTLQFSAFGAAEKKFVDIFSKGKYAKTLGAGLNFNFFPRLNRAWFNQTDNPSLYPSIVRINQIYTSKEFFERKSADFEDLIALHKRYGMYIDVNKQIENVDIADFDKNIKALSEKIAQLKDYLPDNFASLSFDARTATVEELSSRKSELINNYILKQQLDTLNKLQLNANFNTTFLTWVSLGAKLNNDKYPIFNQDAVAESYVNAYNEYYPTFAFSINMMIKKQKVTYLLFPTLNFKYARKWDSDQLKSLNIPTGTKIIAGQSIAEYKQISYYDSKPERVYAIKADLPLTVYFPKSKFGLDLALTHEIKPKWENFGARFGIYIPIAAGEETLTIEPLLQFSNLRKKDVSFIKEKVSFGFSLSISLPDYITGKK